jgi:Meckel syndrome type 1 protein
VLWERSLHRSQTRRERARRARRNAPRQKGVTLAAGAAILATPALTVASASASSARPGVTKTEVAERAAVSGDTTALLSYGDTGDAVKAVQHEVNVVEDGIFGPITEGAVKSWQLGQGLPATGVVDAKTWASLFRAKVLFYDDGSSGVSQTVSYGAPDSSSTSSPDTSSSSSDTSSPDTSSSSEPAPSAPSEPDTVADPAPSSSTPLSTGGNGCSTDGHIVAPVDGATVTGTFGEDRGDHAHSGEDLAVPMGTPVRAADCGTVSISGTESGYGEMVCVRHAGGLTTCYAHLSERDVSVNEYVKAGQKIGEVGCTGNCTGPHVHFEVRKDGTAINPEPYLQGAETVNGQATSMPSGSGGIGGPTPQDQAEVFGDTGGTTAPAATKHHQLTRLPATTKAQPAATTTPTAAPAATTAPAPSAPAATAPATPSPAATTAPATSSPASTAPATSSQPDASTESQPAATAPAPTETAPPAEAPAPPAATTPAPTESAPPAEAPAPPAATTPAATPPAAPAPTESAPPAEAPAPPAATTPAAPPPEAPAPAPAEAAPPPAAPAPAPAPAEATPPPAATPAPAEAAPPAQADSSSSQEQGVQAPAPASDAPAPAVDAAANGGAAAP